MNWSEIATIVGSLSGVIIWFWSRLDKKFDRLESKMDSGFRDERAESQNEFKNSREEFRNEFKDIREEFRNEFKDVHGEFKEIRTSLNRMEGAFYSKDCCMLKEDKEDRKAE